MKLAALRLSAALTLSLLTAVAAHATPLTITLSAVSPVSIAPSDDTVALNLASTSVPTGSGHYSLQTGSFYVGYSPIPDQIIPFSFLDTVTVNGITRDITISGQNNVTTAVDYLTIFAGDPVSFGDITLQISALTTEAGGVGQNIPFTLSADLSQTPEPSSIILLGTGVVSAAGVLRRRLA